MKQSTKRNTQVDVLKGLAIILVVIGYFLTFFDAIIKSSLPP